MSRARPHFDYDEWQAELTVVGDEAYLPTEEAPVPRKRGRPKTPEERVRNAAWMRERRADPAYRQRERQRERERRHLSQLERERRLMATYAALSDDELAAAIERASLRLANLLQAQKQRKTA